MHFAQQLQGAKATFPPYEYTKRKYTLYQKEKTKKIQIKREKKKEEKGNNLF